MAKLIIHDHNDDGVDRRGFLECMAWAGTGVLWTVGSGILSSQAFGQNKKNATKGELHFVQISDSHMGFNKPANPDVAATLQATIDKINGLPQQPDFIIHTGDLSHMSKAAEFDTLDQVLKGAKAKQVFFVPGEHDTSIDDGKMYMERYGKSAKGRGWYSFNHKDVHFVGLSNVAALEGLGKLGPGPDPVARSGPQAPAGQPSGGGLRAYPAVVGLSGLGLGHRRQRAGAGVPQAVRICHRAERAHPPGHAEGGRQLSRSTRRCPRRSRNPLRARPKVPAQ